MKKQLFIMGCLALSMSCFSTGAIGQQLATKNRQLEVSQVAKHTKKPAQSHAKALIWSEDFDVAAPGDASTTLPITTVGNSPGQWTAGGGPDDGIWKHSYYTTSGPFSTPGEIFESTTYSNGFMLFDADSANALTPTFDNYSGELVSPVIDISAATSNAIMLEFEQDFRFCCKATHLLEVSVSTDGGANWSAAINAAEGITTNQSYNPFSRKGYLIRMDLSALIPNNTLSIQLKFHWDGITSENSHYYWAIDDLALYDMPDNDLVSEYPFFIGENNEGVYYAHTPVLHLDDAYYIGDYVTNFGLASQTNVTANSTYSPISITGNGTVASLASKESEFVFDLVTTPIALGMGVQSGTHTVSSDQDDATGPFADDNVHSINFNVSQDMYAQDGLDINPVDDLIIESIGPTSFSPPFSSMVVASMYHIKKNSFANSIVAVLGASTTLGSEITGMIIDTVELFNNSTSPLYVTDPHVITQTDLAQGFVILPFTSSAPLAEDAYFAAVELNVDLLAGQRISILDDHTVDQVWYASIINLPVANGTSYNNGASYAVRLYLTDDDTGLEENEVTRSIQANPNPSNGAFVISAPDLKSSMAIEIHDVQGKIVHSSESSLMQTPIDVRALQDGIYYIHVTTEGGHKVMKIVKE